MNRLSSAWLKLQWRQAFYSSRLRWGISELWLGGISLATLAVLSGWFGLHFLGNLGSRLDHWYLHWYLEIAWVSLALSAMASWFWLLVSPDSCLLHLSPISPQRLFTARIAYALALNALFFTVITLPSLGVVGTLLTFNRLFFVLLPITSITIVITSTVFGAAVSLGVSWLVWKIPERWKGILVSVVSPLGIFSSYAVLTWALPRLLPLPPLRRGTLITNLAGEILEMAGTTGDVPGAPSIVLSLLTLTFVFIFYLLAKRASLIKIPVLTVPAPWASLRRAGRFRPLAMFRSEVRTSWLRAVLAGAGTGVLSALLLKPVPSSPPLELSLLVLWWGYVCLTLITGARRSDQGLLRDRSSFFLVKASPKPPFRMMWEICGGFLASHMAGIAITIGVYTAGAGVPWGEVLVVAAVLVPGVIVPLAIIWFGIDRLFSPDSGTESWSSTIKFIVVLLFVIGAGGGAVGLVFFPPPNLLLGGVATRAGLIFAGSLGAGCLLLRLAAWRLERWEWR